MVTGIHRHTKRCERYSERKNTRCPSKITNPISDTALFFIYLSHNEKIIHNTEPSSIHNTIIHTNCQIHVNILSIHHFQLNIVANVTRKSAIAVQSLKRLSHSKIRRSLFGTHNVLNSDNTATGSVADMIIHSKKHSDSGSSYHISHDIYRTHTHTIPEHIIIHTVASPQIGR